jgi:hypothetical protein
VLNFYSAGLAFIIIENGCRRKLAEAELIRSFFIRFREYGAFSDNAIGSRDFYSFPFENDIDRLRLNVQQLGCLVVFKEPAFGPYLPFQAQIRTNINCWMTPFK